MCDNLCNTSDVLILLRHGRTANNAEARLQGDSDIALDEVGELQAERAGEFIRSRWQINTVVTTSLQRSQQTAELAGFSSRIHEVDDRWREISYGEFEGRRIGELDPDLGVRWQRDVNYRPAGGESLASLYVRVADACRSMVERAAEENVLVVSHATPIKSAVIWASGGAPTMILNLWVYPGSVSLIDYPNGRPLLSGFNHHF